MFTHFDADPIQSSEEQWYLAAAPEIKNICEVLGNAFNSEELSRISINVGIVWDELPGGDNLSKKIVHLVRATIRNNKIAALIYSMRIVNPSINLREGTQALKFGSERIMSPVRFPPGSVEQIDAYFDTAELISLCLDLQVSWEHIEGNSKTTKIINLLLLLQRQNKFTDLLERVRLIRPHVSGWIFAGEDPNPPIPEIPPYQAQPTNLAQAMRSGLTPPMPQSPSAMQQPSSPVLTSMPSAHPPTSPPVLEQAAEHDISPTEYLRTYQRTFNPEQRQFVNIVTMNLTNSQFSDLVKHMGFDAQEFKIPYTVGADVLPRLQQAVKLVQRAIDRGTAGQLIAQYCDFNGISLEEYSYELQLGTDPAVILQSATMGFIDKSYESPVHRTFLESFANLSYTQIQVAAKKAGVTYVVSPSKYLLAKQILDDCFAQPPAEQNRRLQIIRDEMVTHLGDNAQIIESQKITEVTASIPAPVDALTADPESAVFFGKMMTTCNLLEGKVIDMSQTITISGSNWVAKWNGSHLIIGGRTITTLQELNALPGIESFFTVNGRVAGRPDAGYSGGQFMEAFSSQVRVWMLRTVMEGFSSQDIGSIAQSLTLRDIEVYTSPHSGVERARKLSSEAVNRGKLDLLESAVRVIKK